MLVWHLPVLISRVISYLLAWSLLVVKGSFILYILMKLRLGSIDNGGYPLEPFFDEVFKNTGGLLHFYDSLWRLLLFNLDRFDFEHWRLDPIEVQVLPVIVLTEYLILGVKQIDGGIKVFLLIVETKIRR
jgi:hypothetical protein